MHAVLNFACVVLSLAIVSPGLAHGNDPSFCECIGRHECAETFVKTRCPKMCQPVACNDGFITLSGKCYKMFKDKSRTWAKAKAKCEEEDLLLAKPADDVAVDLRKSLLDIYGESRVWLDARGDGYNVVWQDDGSELSRTNSLWSPGEPGRYVGTGWCLYMPVARYHYRDHPTTPYYMGRCSYREWLGSNPRYTLCEATL